MIRKFEIDNFKSLVDFSLPMPPHALGRFVCLIGLNGAGKSTVLQALDFLGHVGSGDVTEWLKARDWQASDLTSRFLKKQLITFKLEFEFEQLGSVVWEGSFNSVLKRCTSEFIAVNGEPVLIAKDQKLFARLLPSVSAQDTTLAAQHIELQNLSYQGSTLSLLRSGRWHAAIEAVRESLGALKSLDMLSPQAMRQRAKDGVDIGYGGERLSAYVHGMDAEGKQRLVALLQEFYPFVEGLTTRAVRAGWKELSVGERYLDAADKPLNTSTKQLNDGLLRILAILVQVEIGRPAQAHSSANLPGQQVPKGCVLFDEIENGVNPELMKKLVEKLIHAPQQVMVTTHSPLILNYLPIRTAEESVILLYRDGHGHTKSVRFFDLPSVSRKLGLLGPGEVFVDTDLTKLPEEVEQWQRTVAEAAVRSAVVGLERAVEQVETARQLSRSAIRKARRSADKPSDEGGE
jgi:energy-coupling factor transporter ATP-binding protein EcfA2